MSSVLDVRLGVLTPQIVHLPPDVASLAAAEEAIELADAYLICDGNPLDESQRFTLNAGLGERADGSWAAATVGDFEPRQAGKNDTCNARELAGLVVFGERLILHTAHEFATANESFLRMVAIFEAWDDLRKLVARIRYANGEQGIEFLSGQRLKYRARTGGSGRGFAKADLLVYDEAQHLQAEHVAASGPARLANPNNQSWYMGSGGLATSRNAWRMRRRALAGDGGRFAYVEHTAEQVSVVGDRVVSVRPDVLDRAAWAEANPAYGRRISDESLLSLYDELGPELFARECLCVWDAEPTAANAWLVIPEPAWTARTDPGSKIDGARSFAVEVTPEREWSTIAVAGTNQNARPHRELVEHRTGTGWLVARVVELNERWQPTHVAVDAGAAAGSFIDELEAAGVPVLKIQTPELKQACGSFFDDATDGNMVHIGQPELTAAVAQAQKRKVGEAWAWDRYVPGGTILSAVSLAGWAHSQPGEGPSIYEQRGLVST